MSQFLLWCLRVCNNCSIPLGKGIREALYAKSILNHFTYLTYAYLDLTKLFWKGDSIEDASPLNTHCHQGALEN